MPSTSPRLGNVPTSRRKNNSADAKGSMNIALVARNRVRPHRKSRTGCAGCRERRVKCDEKRPVCTSCAQRDLPCVFPAKSAKSRPDGRSEDGDGSGSRGSSLIPEPPPQPSSTSPTSTTSQPSQPPQPAYQKIASLAAFDSITAFPRTVQSRGDAAVLTYSLNDIALMHHWSFVVSSTICLADSELDLWRRVFPEIGFQFPFVAHCLLSVASLHIASKCPDLELRGQHVSSAIFHHNAGLIGFSHAFKDITTANSEALFVWSLLNLVYVLGIFLQDLDTDSSLNKDLILGAEWIPMLLGISAVLQPTRDHLNGGRMTTFLSIGNWDDLELGSTPGDKIDAEMCRLRETWEGSTYAPTYEEALQVLRRCHRFVVQFENMEGSELEQWGYNRAWSGPMIFIQTAPETYFTLLRQRQPPALVLFAFFGVNLHGMRHYWFIQDLGKKVVRVVDELLGPYWRPWLEFPINYIGASRGKI